MTILGQTLQLAFRIAIVWTAGFLLAVAVHALLPGRAGITLYGKESSLVVSYNRIGFWTCLLAAVTVTALVVLRAMRADWGGSRFNRNCQKDTVTRVSLYTSSHADRPARGMAEAD
jgi:hypothetical protein